MIDLHAVLRASQTISSQTSIERLTELIGDLIRGLTGATRLILHDQSTGEWRVHSASDQLPLSILRHVERTREPLVVEDLKLDDRFAHDPALASVELMALMAVPIMSADGEAAILLLENDTGRGAFGTNRLEVVPLLAGN